MVPMILKRQFELVTYKMGESGHLWFIFQILDALAVRLSYLTFPGFSVT